MEVGVRPWCRHAKSEGQARRQYTFVLPPLPSPQAGAPRRRKRKGGRDEEDNEKAYAYSPRLRVPYRRRTLMGTVLTTMQSTRSASGSWRTAFRRSLAAWVREAGRTNGREDHAWETILERGPYVCAPIFREH